MPSAINTYLGWMLFGKIQDSDVVDVANHTLELDELKYMTGSRRFLMRLFLQLIRKMTSAVHGGGKDEWLRDHHFIQHVNLITIDVESMHDKGSAKTRPRNVRGIENLRLRPAKVNKYCLYIVKRYTLSLIIS